MAFKMRMCGSCRRAHPELPRGLSHAKQIPLDPVGPGDSCFCVAAWETRGSGRAVSSETEGLCSEWRAVEVRESIAKAKPRFERCPPGTLTRSCPN